MPGRKRKEYVDSQEGDRTSTVDLPAACIPGTDGFFRSKTGLVCPGTRQRRERRLVPVDFRDNLPGDVSVFIVTERFVSGNDSGDMPVSGKPGPDGGSYDVTDFMSSFF